MRYENLLYETAAAVTTVTINRPQVLNSLNPATIRELASNYDAKGSSFCPIGWWYSGIPSQSNHIKIGDCDETPQASDDQRRGFICRDRSA
jgi:hypothetical protein